MSTVVMPRPDNPWDRLPDMLDKVLAPITQYAEQKAESKDAELLANTPPDQLAQLMPQLKSSKMKQAALNAILQQKSDQQTAPVYGYDPNTKEYGPLKDTQGKPVTQPKNAIVAKPDPSDAILTRGIIQDQMNDKKYDQQRTIQDQRDAAAAARQDQMTERMMTMMGLKADQKTPNEIELAQRASQGDKQAQSTMQTLSDYRAKAAGSKAAETQKSKVTALSPADMVLAQKVANKELAPAQLAKRTGNYNAILAQASEMNPNLNLKEEDTNFQVGKTSAFKTKDIAITAMPGILQKVTDAGKKMDFSNVKFIGKVQAWEKGQVNDPDFVKYMTLRNDALLSIAGVMRGTGATDQAHQVEMEAAAPSLSPKALDAWLEAQQESLAPRLEQYNKIYGRDAKPGEKPMPSKLPHNMGSGETMETPKGTFVKGADGLWHLQE